jgi:hypothetical protein
MILPKRIMAMLLLCTFIIVTTGQGFAQSESEPVPQSPEQVEQLVAPIALYPDGLVAQILSASTYPVQIVQAERWLRQNSNLKGDQLAMEVDKQPWDPSVKALVQFPAVLANMDKNLSWTSALGDAYFNQQQEVMDAVQLMRKQAREAGTLQNTPQQTVVTQGQNIVIQPATPGVVYVPIYNPWIVYGPPIPVYQGYFLEERFGPPGLFFGVGVTIGGFYSRFSWGRPAWGFNWRDRVIIYDRRPYFSRSHTFIPRSPAGRSLRGFNRVEAFPRPRGERDRRADRGFGAPRGQSGIRSGAFSGFDHGGRVGGFSSRGRTSAGRNLRGGTGGRG